MGIPNLPQREVSKMAKTNTKLAYNCAPDSNFGRRKPWQCFQLVESNCNWPFLMSVVEGIIESQWLISAMLLLS